MKHYRLAYKITLVCLIIFGFEQVKSQNYDFVSQDEINSLSVDKQGFIYFISNRTICKFDGKELHNCINAPYHINATEVISEDEIFWASDSLLFKSDKIQNLKINSLPENITRLKYFDQKILIGTSGKGCFINNLTTNQLIFLKETENQFINDILISNNAFYLALDSGIVKYDLTNYKILANIELNEKVIQQIQLIGNNIIAYTADHELIKLDNELNVLQIKNVAKLHVEKISTFQNKIYALANDAIYCLNSNLESSLLTKGKYSDILAYKNQVFITNEKKVTAVDVLKTQLNSQKNFSLFAVNDSILWIGSEGKILKMENQKIIDEINLPLPYKQNYISAIILVDDMILAGTMGSGLFVFNHDKKLIKHLIFENYENEKNIIQLKFNSDKIWVGYLNGLMLLNKKTFEIEKKYNNILENSYLYSFYPITENEFYLGTSNKGVIHYHNGKIKISYNGNSIYSITKTKNYVVASVENKGVIIFNDKKEIWLNLKNGLRLETIYNLLNIDNMILFVHYQGIDVFTEEDEQLRYISTHNLSEIHLNSQSESNQYLFLGYENGVLKIDKSLLFISIESKLYLHTPKLFDHDIPQGKLKFKYDENAFTFLFESLNYYTPGENFYKYRMLGLEEKWNTTNQEFVSYYNLKPGYYTFEVASGGVLNFKPGNTQVFAFMIQKPYWQQWWFWLIAVLVISSIIYTFMKWREKQIIANETLKNARMQFEFEQLKNQINPHFLFNSFNSLMGMIEEDPKKAIPVVEKLSLLFRNILKYEKEDIITVAEEIEIAKLYFEIHKIRYQDLIDLKIENIENPDQKFIIPLSGQLLIENAIKHNIINKNSPLYIRVYEKERYIVFENNVNLKKNSTHSIGVGLNNLVKRSELIFNQKPVIEQDNSKFIVKIPYKNA